MKHYVNLHWDEFPSLTIYKYKETDSTNTRAREEITNNQIRNALIIADTQTNGRGRAGHTFYSPKDTGVYFSYIFTPSREIDPGLITTAASVGVIRALNKLHPANYLVKWVNDIWMRGKKVSGILTEASTSISARAA